MRAHVPFAWVMGYDLYPVETVGAKKRLLPQSRARYWTRASSIARPDQALGRIVEQDGRIASRRLEH
jgi:hypothetical protein